MVSPAANTSACPTTRRFWSTLRKPLASSGNPACASQRAGAACVVHRISSASTGAWPSSRRRPASTPVTAVPVTTAMPRAARMAWKRERNAAGKLARISGTSDTRTNDSPPTSNPLRATSCRNRCSTESRSSTPPAPAPTSARRVRPLRASTRAMSASNRLRNPSIGLTGMACSLAPGTSAVFGVEPILSESRS